MWSNRYFIRHHISHHLIPQTIQQATIQQPAHFLDDGHPALRANYVHKNCLHSHHFTIFTDGSKMENESTNRRQTGCALVVYQHGSVYHSETARLHDECSVFQSELLAIKKAVSWCLQHGRTAIIKSDSESALKAIANKKNRNQLAVDIRKLLRQHPNHICLSWVKAHVGIEGNEEADRLAKEATNLQSISYDKLPLSFAQRIMTQEVNNDWEALWTASKNGRVTSRFFPTVMDRKKCSNIPDFIMTQFMSGHGKFHKYLTDVTVESDAKCECGALEQTPIHLIMDCPRWVLERLNLESRICEMTNSNQVSLSIYSSDKFYREFYRFVSTIYKQL
jgi:ribonuclease HI